jgi:hypothetical protein
MTAKEAKELTENKLIKDLTINQEKIDTIYKLIEEYSNKGKYSLYIYRKDFLPDCIKHQLIKEGYNIEETKWFSGVGLKEGYYITENQSFSGVELTISWKEINE